MEKKLSEALDLVMDVLVVVHERRGQVFGEREVRAFMGQVQGNRAGGVRFDWLDWEVLMVKAANRVVELLDHTS